MVDYFIGYAVLFFATAFAHFTRYAVPLFFATAFSFTTFALG